MDDMIHRNLGMRFPFIVREAIEYRDGGGFDVIVTLRDGRVILYDDMEGTIRNLPRDINNLSEHECKREFGIRLKRLMYKKGITQSELSERTGIAQTMISSYLTGRNVPSFYKVDRIARALGCSVDDLRYT